jgi:hypothetical protein
MSEEPMEEARFEPLRLLPGVGAAGHQLVRAARIHVVGAGASAGPALLYLAQAGVGTLYLDDGEEVGPGDAGGGLFTQDQLGRPRLFAAVDALARAGRLSRIRGISSDVTPTATLVCAAREPVARAAAERARLAGLAHVAALCDGEGGTVVTIPSGAPCLRCAVEPGALLPVQAAAAAAVGTLAAAELLLVVTRVLPGQGAGRRIDLVGGWPITRPTARRPGCECRVVH